MISGLLFNDIENLKGRQLKSLEKIVANADGNLNFIPNSADNVFVPNYDGSYFLSLIMTVPIFVSNYDGSRFWYRLTSRLGQKKVTVVIRDKNSYRHN
jgi:hypothetical protein